MNYLTILLEMLSIYYLIYIFHECYQQQYYMDIKIVRVYGTLFVINFAISMILPIHIAYMCLCIIFMIIQIVLYHHQENFMRRILSLMISVILALFWYFLIPYVNGKGMLYDFRIQNSAISIAAIFLLYSIKRENEVYELPYIGLVMLEFAMLCIWDVYMYEIMPNDTMSLLHAIPYIFILLFLLLFRISYRLQLSKEKTLELTIKRYAQNENKKNYEKMEEENRNVMRQLHDMKKQLQVLESIEDNQEIQHYKEELKKRTEKIAMDKVCDNTFINKILSSYQSRLEECAIQCNLEFENIDVSFMDTLDICAIFTNLLDNAIESCERCTQRFLQLKMKRQKSFLIIKMKNSAIQICEENGQLMTLKQDKLYHGFGMMNMQFIVQKYGGNLRYEFDASAKVFTTILTIPYLGH